MNKNQYLLIDNLSRLRKKLQESKGTLKFYWEHFRRVSKISPNVLPAYPMFCYLVTGDKEFANIGRDVILKFVRDKDSYMYHYEAVQFHTWCVTAPVARYVIYYDWLADSGVFTRDEKEEINDKFILFMYKYPYQVMKARDVSADNQIAAMAMGCMFAGYLFGYKRDRDKRAQQLFKYALSRFPELVGNLPPGGYSGEGSTYFDQVMAPVLTWMCAFLEQITGEDYLNRKYPPNGVSIRDVLEVNFKLISTSGLLLPWDNYRYHNTSNLMSLAFLSRRTGEDKYLSVIDALSPWDDNSTIAWASDDKVWTLLWWPERKNNMGNLIQNSWMIPNTGAALLSQKPNLHLFQMWDFCNWPPIRCHVNPNSIVLEAFGSPLIMDGTPRKDCKEFNQDKYKIYHKDIDRYVYMGFGTIGAHNNIIINNEEEYTPKESKTGQVIDWLISPCLEIISSEAKDFYQPRYKIRSIRRTTFFIKPYYYVVKDTIISEQKYRYSWRAHLRVQAEKKGNNITVDTAERVRLYLKPIKSYDVTTKNINGFPDCLEGKSIRLEYHQQDKDAEFMVLFMPEDLKEELCNVTECWRFIADLGNKGIREKWYQPNYKDSNWKIIPIDKPWFYYSQHYINVIGWYRKKVIIPSCYRNRKIYLKLGKINKEFALWVNGIKIVFTKPDPLVTPVIDITRGIKFDKENLIAIRVKSGVDSHSLENGFKGKAAIYAKKEKTSAPIFREINTKIVLIESIFGRDYLLHNNSSNQIVAIGDFKTDASYGVIQGNDKFSLLKATKLLKNDKIIFIATLPIDICVQDNEYYLGNLSSSDFNTIKIIKETGEIEVKIHNFIEFQIMTTESIKICFRADRNRTIIVNGEIYRPHYEKETNTFWIECKPKNRKDKRKALQRLIKQLNSEDENKRMNAAVELGRIGSLDAVNPLLNVLNDYEWVVKLAVIESLGELKDKRAEEPLLKLLDKENRKNVYEGENEERWRIKMELVRALGKIKSRKAVGRLCQMVIGKDFYCVRAIAGEALGLIGDKKAIPFLKKVISTDTEINTEKFAKKALLKLKYFK